MYEALQKYCAFMPVPIFIDVITNDEEKVEKAEPEKKDNTIHISQEEAATLTKDEILAKANKDKAEETESAEGSKKEEEKEEEPKPLNDPSPVSYTHLVPSEISLRRTLPKDQNNTTSATNTGREEMVMRD